MNPSPSADPHPLPAGCLSDTDLNGLVNGDESVSASSARHLEECGACRARLEALAGTGSLHISGLRAPDPVPPSLAEAMDALRTVNGVASDSENVETPWRPVDVPLEASTRSGALGSFAGYDILELVAQGGMGIVFKGYDRSLHRVVAIKVLAPALAAGSVARVRFLREARAAAAVNHEHVVAIHAVGEEKGLPYLVMQYVAGRSLQARLDATGPLAPQEVLRVGSQAAYGLAAAHSQGLIHRDVKPGNILLENSVERVKLTDFGLARAADATDVTRPGVVAGTPEFMAPEQARGERLDPRADLFALGTVLYAMATGVSPFQSDSTPATLRRVCEHNPRPVHEVNPGQPRWLGEIIERLMSKRPEDRYSDALGVARVMEEALARLQAAPPVKPGLAESAAEQDPKGRRIGVASILALVVVCGVLGLIWATQGPRGGSDATPFQVRHADGTAEGFTNVAESLAAYRPGDTLEFAWDGPREVAPMESTGRVLHLRAAAGRRPVVVHATRTRPWLRTDSNLRMEGIEMHSAAAGVSGEPVPRPGPSNRQTMESARRSLDRNRTHEPGRQLLACEGADLTLVNCRLVTASGVDEVEVPILLQSCPSVSLVNTELLHAGGPAISWKAANGDRLHLSNCVVMARSAFFFASAGNGVAEFELDQCTFVGTFLVASLSAGDSLRGRGSHNVLSLRRPWVGMPGTAGPGRQRWHGRANVYDRVGVDAGLQIPPTDEGSLLLDLGLDAHVRSRVGAGQAVTPADFVLAPNHRTRLGESAGIVPQWVGPGEAWERWQAAQAGR